MTIPLDRIDLDQVAEALDDNTWDHHHYLDPATGEMHLVSDLMGSTGDIDEETEARLVEVEGEGSRLAYRDMADFAAALADRRLAERLERVLEGKGAFRRFRDTLHREGDDEVVSSWNVFSRARSAIRALEWLEQHDVVERAEIDTARTVQHTLGDMALSRVGVPSSGCRLVLLNGMPGSGKSTLAERYRREHPGVLVVEADRLREWIGGDPADHAEAARHLSLALARAHLEGGYDVVVPQLVARIDELERFVHVAEETGAELVEVVLHGGVVDSRVPEGAIDHLVEYAEGLADVVARRPGTHRLATRHGDVDSAYRALVDLLDPDRPA